MYRKLILQLAFAQFLRAVRYARLLSRAMHIYALAQRLRFQRVSAIYHRKRQPLIARILLRTLFRRQKNSWEWGYNF